ncbi:hypothetical protein EZY14_015580 [Kordia sp. TARA_039_SRF]|nr:hypothetical protein EZY14_015580 [Kordia sp. TARA_039_SRF]
MIHKKVNLNIVLGVILCFLLFDLITKIFHVYRISGFNRYSAIPKLFLEVYLIYLFFKNSKKDIKGISCILILIIISGINLFFTDEKITNELIFNKVYDLNKYIYSFFFAIVLLAYEKNERIKVLTYIRNVLLVIGIINGICMIIGLFTNIELLRSYEGTGRFGYNGLFVKTSETSYMYILFIISTYYEYIKTNKNGLLCLFFIFVSLLIGTKAIWLFILLLTGIHLLLHKNKFIRSVSKVGLALSVLFSFIFYDYIVKLVVNSFSFGPVIYEKHGFLTVLTSKRDLLLMDTIAYINEKGTVLNYLFGGINIRKYGSEFGIVDIFIFFGIIGIIIFTYLIKRIYFKEFAGIHKILLLISLILVTFFAGNFFMSIMCSIFAFVVFQNMDYANVPNKLDG